MRVARSFGLSSFLSVIVQGRRFNAANNCSPVGELRAAVRGMCPGRADPAPTEQMLEVTSVPLRLDSHLSCARRK